METNQIHEPSFNIILEANGCSLIWMNTDSQLDIWMEPHISQFPVLLSSFVTYHRIFISRSTTGTTSGTRTALRRTWVHTRFLLGSCCSNFCFLCNVLSTILCPFILVFLSIVTFYLRLSFWPLCLSVYGFLFGHCVLLFTAFLFGHCVLLFTAFLFGHCVLLFTAFLFGHCVLLFTAFFLAIVSLVLSEQRIPVGLLWSATFCPQKLQILLNIYSFSINL